MSHNLSYPWKLGRVFSLLIVSFFPSFFISYNGSKFTMRVRAALVGDSGLYP